MNTGFQVCHILGMHPFLSSLDGRIALEDVSQSTTYIPKHLTTASDFRLFMELHAQADCLITHGGYMRALSEGRLGTYCRSETKILLNGAVTMI